MSKTLQFESIVDAYADDLYRYALYLCGNHHGAEDLVQETYTLGWRAFHQLREISAAKAWLIKTMRRTYFRQSHQPEMVDLDDIAQHDFENIPQQIDLGDHIDIELRLRTLPPAYREVIVLQLLFGCSTREIAEMVGITEPAACSRLHRARSRLHQKKNATSVPHFKRKTS